MMDIKDYFETGNEKAFVDLLGDIPFGQSDFQNFHLQLKQDNEPHTFRQVLLELTEKFKALKECQFRRKRYEIESRMLQRKRRMFFWSKDRQALIDVEIEENNFKLSMENKMLEDAMHTFTMYKAVYDSMPKMTREEYDKQENVYWQKRAVQQAEEDMQSMGTITQGNVQLLKKLGYDPNKVKAELHVILSAKMPKLLDNARKELLKAPPESGSNSSPQDNAPGKTS